MSIDASDADQSVNTAASRLQEGRIPDQDVCGAGPGERRFCHPSKASDKSERTFVKIQLITACNSRTVTGMVVVSR